MLKPLFKWTGGKRREIKIFSEYYPDIVNSDNYTFIEPFLGGGAVYWSLQAPNNIVNDVDPDITNFLQHLKDDPTRLKEEIDKVGIQLNLISLSEKEGELSIGEAKELRGEYYYKWRNVDREYRKLSDFERACRFYIVNQLAFNGMRRFNKKGQFNVPYGNYKYLNFNLEQQHLDLLDNTEIHNTDYKTIISDNDRDDVFIYLDPPYTRIFKEYQSDNVFGYEKQMELMGVFKSIKNAKVMLIINKDEFTTEIYKEYIKHEYALKYSTNIKNRYSQEVSHLVVCNY